MANKALMNETLLQLKELETGYSGGKKPVVISRRIETSLALGQFVAILGPNGAGKSTLMKTILGHLVPLSGEVLWKGRPLHQMSVKQVARCMSAVLTDKIEDRYLTAMDVVSTGRYPYGSLTGRLTQEDRQIISSSMKSTGVTHLSERRFFTLSDGEKQKTMIARALAQNTPLICLDEPTAFIDSPGKVAIMQLLKRLVDDKTKTVLLTTHDSELALQFADELWLVGKNHTFEAGTPTSLIGNGHINQLFDQEGVIFNPNTLRFESTYFEPEL
jgi:iron complex transport system ATP-binding protein